MRSEHQKTIDQLIMAEFIRRKRKEMAEAVEQLDFETAALIRDEIYKLEGGGPKVAKRKKKMFS